MPGIWLKSIVQSAFAAVISFFSVVFLEIMGIKLFASSAFEATGLSIIFLFILFNVFIVLNWK